ncbi:unnamed protein product [Schistocephalus solidus]|uniref:Uncharacterized protein n=1 Tax=Schistocephalus solidus TaxID=70667 RepID=A0A183TQ86_SCHSO|nr:unnamed protein product [Schistocephalus solidus]
MTGRAGNRSDPRCRWLNGSPPRHLAGEAPTATPMKAPSPRIKETAPLLSSDGTTLLTEKSQILKRWAKHVRSVLNCSSAISYAAIDRLPRGAINNDLDLPPSLPKTIWAMQYIFSGKAPGSDAIPQKVYKHDRHQLMAELTTLFR